MTLRPGDVPTLVVCTHRRGNPRQPSCGARGSSALAERLTRALAERGVTIAVEHSACLGYCADGANLRLAPGGPFLHSAHDASVEDLVQAVEVFLAERR